MVGREGMGGCIKRGLSLSPTAMVGREGVGGCLERGRV